MCEKNKGVIVITPFFLLTFFKVKIYFIIFIVNKKDIILYYGK